MRGTKLNPEASPDVSKIPCDLLARIGETLGIALTEEVRGIASELVLDRTSITFQAAIWQMLVAARSAIDQGLLSPRP